MIELEPMIKIEHLDKTFKGKTQTVYALKDINLDIQKGDIFGIIGMSGAGKSTLIRCMNFLERPTSGTVKIDGKDLAALSDKELRKTRQEVAMIFQHFNLLQQRNVRGNIAFSMEIAGMKREDIDKRIDELLEIVDLKDRALMYPAQLSGGQKQRVAIARAMVNHPKLLLADEPTGALDSKSGKQVLELFESLNESGVTVVVITHDRKVAEQAKRIVHIIDGEITEEGQEAGNEKEKEN